jgi:fused signal recognition particle receptor
MFNFFKKDKPESNAEENKLQPAVTAAEAEPNKSWAERLKQGLAKTRNQLGNQLAGIFGGGKIDAEVYEELESILLTSDVGISATEFLLDDIKNRVKRQSLDNTAQLKTALKEALSDLLLPLQKPLETTTHKPFIIMLAGVNGAGKTTTIGKLAKHFQSQGKSVLIAAGDTFRAAAREQLQIWGERNNVHVVAKTSGDPAAVMFDAINSALAKDIDIVLADTAGRLPTQLHLMEEIAKVKRVMDKALPGAPHEVLLVLDSNTGQNAVNQVRIFDDALGVTGLVLSKLDGTAKGGVIAAIAQARPIPIRYIGIGEAIDDLRPFNAAEFIDAMID